MIVNCDVLIVGSGGAGLRAAIAAKEENPNANVCIVDKGKFGSRGATATGYSDRMAFQATLEHTEPRGQDSWVYHANDIYSIGGEISDPLIACILALKSRDSYEYLERLGVPFVEKEGIPHQFVTDGSDYARACYTGPKTAIHIYAHLLRRARELRITFMNDCFIFKLISADNRVIGALGLLKEKDGKKESPIGLLAKSVIIATGGGGNVYKNSLFSKIMTGDGLAIAYDLGCKLINLEFFQIGLGIPELFFCCTGSLFRSLPSVVNDQGEDVLATIYENDSELIDSLFLKGSNWPVAYEKWKTTLIDVACSQQNKKGNKVYLDYSRNPSKSAFTALSDELVKRYKDEIKVSLGEDLRQESPINRLKEIDPAVIEWLKKRGIDLEAGAKIEITSCIQHFQGGIKINPRSETNVSGLFAAGECAGGQHGLIRPGGNALLDCQVFGEIAGIEAIRYLRRSGFKTKYRDILATNMRDVFSNYVSSAEKENEYLDQIKQIMADEAGVIRSYKGLEDALNQLKSIEKAINESKKLMNINKDTIQADLALTTANLILTACLNRRESRGPHLLFDENKIIPSDSKYKKAFCLSKNHDKKDSEEIVIESVDYANKNLMGL